MKRFLSYMPTIPVLMFAALSAFMSWVGDDAFITFRVVDNFVDGYGLRYNIAERVEVFTNPLWLFVMAAVHAFTGEFLISAQVTGWTVSLLAIIVAVRASGTEPWRRALAAGLLASSIAIIEYATSGLENPASFLLVALFVGELLRDEPRPMVVYSLFGLALFNRMDALVLYAPGVAWVALGDWRQRRWSVPWRLALGLSPFLVWRTFATVYYGNFVPNTALAKLNHAHGPWTLLETGVTYYGVSLINDPLMALSLIVAPVFAWRLGGAHRAVAVGILLHCAYVLKIGGDFMAGRFWSVPAVAAIILLVRSLPPLPRFRRSAVLVGCLIPLIMVGVVFRRGAGTTSLGARQ